MKIFPFLMFLLTLMNFHDCEALNKKDSYHREGEFSINPVLQSHMVIQQGQTLVLWGTGNQGETVRIQADWASEPVESKVDPDGKWLAEIMVPKATEGDFTKHNISLTQGVEKIKLHDLLIGEVWLCSGQSNMDMEMEANPPWLEGVLDFEREIAAADFAEIRFIKIEKKFTKEPIEEAKGTWQLVTLQTAGDLSGVAYYFGRELHQRLNIPIGLVVSSFGGSAAQAWTSREALNTNEDIKSKYLDPYDKSNKPQESLENVETFEEIFEILARPTLLYNGMIYPIRNLSVRGFLWYQGESNKLEAQHYPLLSSAMIEGWRKDFPGEGHPFYYVQMPAYNWEENDSTATYYARFREAQEAVLSQVANTGMISTMDIGEVDNIHPRNKKDVGLRLSNLALNKTYGKNETAWLGPLFSSFEINESTVIVEFEEESLGSGLVTNDGQAPKHFYVAGDDQVFYPADAKIDNNSIVLNSNEVNAPVAVRYAFTNYPITNLQNKEGLPAYPFRTDEWTD
ncbi:sialate O-acetylesterase [Litoribacter populi]|uniref:sialate O-acetylesterase n=1 Tax=Litoribacter populi TaxID=2598460 RepID=UPI00117EC1EB|nr:sialate O-acetylesterase [Litoribacter populi]